MRKAILAGAAALSLASVPALAQDTATTTTTTADDTAMMTTAPVEDDDDDFPWGLLGLLGLAGLLGRNRRDTHVHHDNTVRRDV